MEMFVLCYGFVLGFWLVCGGFSNKITVKQPVVMQLSCLGVPKMNSCWIAFSFSCKKTSAQLQNSECMRQLKMPALPCKKSVRIKRKHNEHMPFSHCFSAVKAACL